MVFLLISLGLGISVAGSVLVAQYTGADEPREAEYAASQTVTFAWGPFPELGIQGAALATVFSRGLALAVGLVIMFRGVRGIQINLGDMTPDPTYLKRLARIGVPASVEGTGRALSLNVLLFIVALFPDTVVAAYGIGTRVFSVIFLPAIAVAQGVETMTGQNVGADKPDRAATAAGLAALVWGMLRIFRSLDMAFSDIYETGLENTFLDQLKDSIVVFGSLATLVIGVIGLESVFSVFDASGVALVGQRLLLICIIALALVPMYYLFPDESGMHILETVPGVLFTATALVVLQSVFGLYVTYSDPTADNQLLASIIVLLTWLYFCGLVLLVGAVINAVLSNRSEDVNIHPIIRGVPKKETAGLDVTDQQVPVDALDQLRNSLNDSTKLQMVFDDGTENVELPPPDKVSTDSDSSPIPVIKDTASLKLEWSEATIHNDQTE